MPRSGNIENCQTPVTEPDPAFRPYAVVVGTTLAQGVRSGAHRVRIGLAVEICYADYAAHTGFVPLPTTPLGPWRTTIFSKRACSNQRLTQANDCG